MSRFRSALRAVLLPALMPTLILGACNGAAPAAEVSAGGLRISAATSRETPIPGAVAVGYLHIDNRGKTDDLLLGASAALASSVELHEMKTVDGVMQMRALTEGLAIPAGQGVDLKSGGAHLMLIGVARPLVAGETIPVTLHFKAAGDVAIALKVEPLAAGNPASR